MVSRLKSAPALALENFVLGVALIFLLLRLYVRSWLQSRYDVSDALITAAFLLFCAGNTIDALNCTHGLWAKGIVFTSAGPPDMRPIFKDDGALRNVLMLLYIGNIPYYTALWFVKFAFLRLYCSLIPRGSAMVKTRLALQITTVFTILSWIVTLCLNLFYCWPVQRNWDIVRSTACYTVFSAPPYFISVALHLISDFMIYALPFFLLPTLRASRSYSSLAGLIAVFSLGGLSIAISIGRVVQLGDAVWMPSMAVWSAAEQAGAIVVVCSPPLKWLITSIRRHGFRAKQGTLAEPREMNNGQNDPPVDPEKRIGGGIEIPGVHDVAIEIKSPLSMGSSWGTGTLKSTLSNVDPVMSVRSERVLSVEEFERRRTRELLEVETKSRQQREQEGCLERGQRGSWRSSRGGRAERSNTDESGTLRTLSALDDDGQHYRRNS